MFTVRNIEDKNISHSFNEQMTQYVSNEQGSSTWGFTQHVAARNITKGIATEM